MGSYLQIEITGPLVELEKVKLRKLPTWELWDVIGWDLDEIIHNQYTGAGVVYTHTGDWHITLEGNSKWTCEQSFIWARYFTEKRPALTVKVRDEWDNRDADEPGVEERIYRKGELDMAESKQNGEVPMNLNELLDAARFALTVSDPVPAREALTALIAGLS